MTIATTCRSCGQEFEPSHEAIVAGAWHMCPACRDAERPPLAACVVSWSSRGGYWAVVVPACPLCGKTHHHGGGVDPRRVDLGYRSAHWWDRTDSYELVETPASSEARARLRAERTRKAVA